MSQLKRLAENAQHLKAHVSNNENLLAFLKLQLIDSDAFVGIYVRC